jgi:hypothetical protein
MLRPVLPQKKMLQRDGGAQQLLFWRVCDRVRAALHLCCGFGPSSGRRHDIAALVSQDGSVAPVRHD